MIALLLKILFVAWLLNIAYHLGKGDNKSAVSNLLNVLLNWTPVRKQDIRWRLFKLRNRMKDLDRLASAASLAYSKTAGQPRHVGSVFDKVHSDRLESMRAVRNSIALLEAELEVIASYEENSVQAS